MTDRGRFTPPGTLTFERLLPGPIERVWEYLVDPAKRARWFCGGALEGRVGGVMELVFDDRKITDVNEPVPERYRAFAGEVRFPGRVTAWDPPRHLAFAWIESDGAESLVDFRLAAEGDRVRLVLTHTGLSGDPARISTSAGWHAHLAILGDEFAGRPRRAFWSEHAVLEREYELP